MSPPPTGYVWGHDGRWKLHPDLEVQTALRTIFRVFLEQRSPKTVRALRRLGVQVPARVAGVHVRWVEAMTGNIARVLNNPRYTGRYVYRAQEQRRGAHALEQARVERARRRAADLEQRYMLVDPTNRLVAEHLEAAFERAKREVSILRAAGPGTRSDNSPVLHRADLEELEHLGGDVSALFHAPTTANQDRKELVRLLVDHVRVIERTTDRIELRVVWRDLQEPTRISVPTAAFVRRRVRELAASGHGAREIWEQLRDVGLESRYGSRWTLNAVRMVLARGSRPRAGASTHRT